MKSAHSAVFSHIISLYLFRHNGTGLPSHKTGFLSLFALTCLAISLACQTSVVLCSPQLFERWSLSETCYSVGMLYLPAVIAFFSQKAPEVFSLCVFYLVFSVSGAIGSLLMPLLGALAAMVSLGVAGWSILVYLWFTPAHQNELETSKNCER